MTSAFRPAKGLLAQLTLLRVECSGPVVHLRLNRPDKRNAINGTLVRELQTAFANLPSDARAAVISGEGGSASARLATSRTGRFSRAEA